MFDYHIHPDYSIDAEGTVAQHCETALARGLTEVCFTTHLDTEPESYSSDARICVAGEWVSVDSNWLPGYLESIATAREAFRPQGLVVKAGIEIGYHDGVVERYGRVIADAPFDYVLGSVHRIDGLAVTMASHLAVLMARLGRSSALETYYNTLRRAATSGMFDCLAHIDVYRRTEYRATEDDVAASPVRESAQEFLRAAAAAGVGIEINGRNGRDGPGYLSPGPTLLGMAIEAGIPLFTLGSDAHEPASVGAGVAVAQEMLRRAGVIRVATFDRRRPVFHDL